MLRIKLRGLCMQAQVEVQLRASQQKVSGLQSELARAECLLDSHAVAKMKLPLFPMSPLAAPPVRHDKDKENSGSRLSKGSRHQVRLGNLLIFKVLGLEWTLAMGCSEEIRLALHAFSSS